MLLVSCKESSDVWRFNLSSQRDSSITGINKSMSLFNVLHQSNSLISLSQKQVFDTVIVSDRHRDSLFSVCLLALCILLPNVAALHRFLHNESKPKKGM